LHLDLEVWRFLSPLLKGVLGIDLKPWLGVQLDDFLAYPQVGTSATHLIFAGFLLAGTVAIAAGLRVVWLTYSEFVRRGRNWAEIALGTTSESAFLQSSTVVGFGLLMTIPGFHIYQHYLITAFPVQWVLGARLLSTHRRLTMLLPALWAIELFITITFLYYIHKHHGARYGGYGAAFDSSAH
jgi:hypothetical protein